MDRIEPVADNPWERRETDADKDAIIRFVAGCSVGSLCLPASSSRSDRELLPPETRCHIAAVPDRPLADTIAAAKALRSEGFEPVPDIVARRFQRAADLDEFLHRIRGEADVREVLVIGADNRSTAKPATSPLDLLKTGLFDARGIRRIGVAAYPLARCTGVSDPGTGSLARYNALAEQSDATVHFVTRPGQDADAVLAWEESARRAGNRLPIQVGLLGPAPPGPLPDLERLCGIGASHPDDGAGGFDPLARVALTAPDAMLAVLARHGRENPNCTLHPPHFVTSGGLSGTALWLDAVLRGAFTMRPSGNGFAARFHARS